MIKIHDVHDLKKKNDGLSSRNSGEKFYIAEKSPLENCYGPNAYSLTLHHATPC